MSTSRRQRATQMAHRAKMMRAKTLASVKDIVRTTLNEEGAGPQVVGENDDAEDVVNYGDTVRLHSLTDNGFMFGEGYDLNDVLWRPTRNTDAKKNESVFTPTTAAQFTIVCKHTYDKAKQLQKKLNSMGARTMHEIHAKQAEEDIDPSLIRAIYELQGPVQREKRHNLAEISRSLGEDVQYGASIQLRHTSTGKFVTLDTKRCGRETGSLAVTLDREGSEHSWLTVTPAFRVRKNGDPVAVNDQVKLVFESRSEEEQVPVYLRATPGTQQHDKINPALDGFEVCGHDEYTRWKILRFAGVTDMASSSRLRSGMSLRLTHREENAYLSLGELPDGQVGLHMISKELVPSCKSSPRTLWTIVQTNITSSSMSLLDRRSRNNLGDLEVGGGIMWRNLCFVQNLVGGSFLQVEGKQIKAIKPSSAHQIDLTSILFQWVPVDDKKGEECMHVEDLFYVKHSATGQWLHISKENATEGLELPGVSLVGSSNSNLLEPNVAVSRQHEHYLRLSLKDHQPYEDAFGVESCAPLEVEDYQEIASIVPMFEKFIRYIKADKTDPVVDTYDMMQALNMDVSESGNTTTVLSRAEIVELGMRLERKLGDLITGFITTKNLDPNPITARGMIHSTRRQDLLREVGLMQLLCEMCECLTDARDADASHSLCRDQVRSNVLLGNVLLKHLVRGHDENCRFLVEHGHIEKFKVLIDADVHIAELLTEIYMHNDELLRDPGFPQHLDDWLAKLRQSIQKDGQSAGLYLRFLASTCVCNGQAVRPNQVKILKELFVEDNRCVMQISEVDGELTIKSFDGKSKESVQKLFFDEDAPSRDIEVISPDRAPNLLPPPSGNGSSPRRPRTPHLALQNHIRAMQNFVVESMRLFTNLCVGRHEAAVTKIRQLYPRTLLSNIVQTQRLGCELLRAQAMELFIAMYVDYPPFVDTPTVAYTREWSAVKQHDSTISQVLPFEAELDPINNWVLDFLKENTEQVKELTGLNKLVLACIKFVHAALRVGYYNSVHDLKPQLLVLIKILDGRTDREVPKEAGIESSSSVAFTDGWFRPWNQHELEVLAQGIANAPAHCYDVENRDLNRTGWEWLSEKVSNARSGVARSREMCANRWHERVAGVWRYEENEETLVLTQTKRVICQIFNLACEVRLNARLTHILALFIEPQEKVGASIPIPNPDASTMVNSKPEQDLCEFDTDTLPLPGQPTLGSDSSSSPEIARLYSHTPTNAAWTQGEDSWPRVLGDEQSRQSEQRWKVTNSKFYHKVVDSYPVISTWEEACEKHTEIRDAMNLLRFEDYTGKDTFAGCKRRLHKRIENCVKDTLKPAEQAVHLDLEMDGDIGVEQAKKNICVNFDDILLDLLMYSDTTMTAEAAKLLINVHSERQELVLALQKVQLLKDPASIAFAEKAAGDYQKQLKAFFVSNREEEAEKLVVSVLSKMCAELCDVNITRASRLSKQRLFDNLGIDDDVVAIVNTGRFTTEDAITSNSSRWSLYQEAYRFLREMCIDNPEMQEKLSRHMRTYFVHIELAGHVQLNAEDLIHEIYDGNVQLAQQVTSEQIRFYCRLMSRPDPEIHGKYPNLQVFGEAHHFFMQRLMHFLENFIVWIEESVQHRSSSVA